MICITQYDEPFERLLDSIAGIVRSVVELQQLSKSRFTGSIGIAVLADGFDALEENFLLHAESLRMIDRRDMLEYF